MKTCFYIFICFLIIATDCAYAEISVDFSHQRGFHNESFDLEIKTFGYNVSARYTLDGSEPTSKYGTVPSNSSSFKIPNINSSTVVRVYAYNIEEDVSDAHTYIFTADVFNQNNNTVINEHNYPVEWGYGTSLFGSIACSTQAADYEMTLDDCRENNAAYIEELEAGLKEIPTISISLDKDQVFGPDSGIYVFPVEKPDTCYTLPQDVHSWERQASVEIFNNGQENDLQINAGLQISGASTRYFDFYKHSFKLKFRSEYGKSKLTYPLFEDNTSKKIESLQLRMLGHSTPHDWVSNRREETQFHKDNWARNIQKELSGYGTDSKFFHLFINGLYWGLYDVSERPDADYMAENYGGMPEDYDVIKLLEVKSGTDSAYNYMHDLGHLIYDTIKTISSVNPFTGQNVYNIDIVPNKEKAINFYNETKELLDIGKFIDYNLFNLYVVNTDWKENNWWVARNAKQNEKFKFFVWDAEIILNDAGKSNQVLLYAGNTGVNLKYHPTLGRCKKA